MKIALASELVRNRDPEFNMQSMEAAMENCRGGSELILFGETALQGFDCLRWDYGVDRSMAVALTDAPIRRLRDAAREKAIAVSFGFIERAGDALYSSQLFIGSDGEIVHLFRRVSRGWKEYRRTDGHYREGAGFEAFSYRSKRISTGLCGDLWTDGRPAEMKALNADVVLWPVWCDYTAGEWNGSIKYEYARQAALCGRRVLLVNPYCADPDADNMAAGGAAWFENGEIVEEMPAGQRGILVVDVP